MEKLTLKQARNLANLTQDEVAKMIGVSMCTYRVYEKDPERMTIRRALLFSKAVNRPINGLIFAQNSN